MLAPDGRQVGAIDASETLALGRGNAALLPTAAMYGVPMALRFLKYGSGKGLPRDQLDKGMMDTMIPGRWANYGEMAVGYQEERHGGDYLKQLQNTKPLPMWWRYNGKTACTPRTTTTRHKRKLVAP